MSSCGGANQYTQRLVGDLNTQMNNAHGGTLDVLSSNYSQSSLHQGSLAGQVGGRRRHHKRTRRGKSSRRKFGRHKKHSRRIIRKRR